jgi:hypothetical protein
MSKDYSHEPCMTASFVRTDMGPRWSRVFTGVWTQSFQRALVWSASIESRKHTPGVWLNRNDSKCFDSLSPYPTKRVLKATSMYLERLQKWDVSQSNDRKRFWTLDMKGRSSCLYERAASNLNSLNAWMNTYTWVYCDPDMGIMLSD